jgi:hypothetical protein
MDWVAIILLRTLPFLMTAADVSSQDDSMARMVGNIFLQILKYK